MQDHPEFQVSQYVPSCARVTITKKANIDGSPGPNLVRNMFFGVALA